MFKSLKILIYFIFFLSSSLAHSQSIDGLQEIVKNQQISHDKGSKALRATSVISDDGIIDPRDTRNVLGMCLSIVNNKEVKGSEGFGVFRL